MRLMCACIIRCKSKIQIAPDNTLVIACKGAFEDLYKDRAPEIALKGARQVALQFHLFMQLSMRKSVQYDSVKGEIEVALYTALDSASKIPFQGALKTA